jgi:hypothetical protein
MYPLSKKEATDFFADFYGGEHHIPNEVIPIGNNGWEVADVNSLATTDFDGLTKLVVMAHDRCMRVALVPCGVNRYKLVLHKRVRGVNISISHPTIEDSIIRIRNYKKFSGHDK